MAFLYPSFLIALGAIAIPIILHLVQLRRAKRIEFSNVHFIKASQEVTASQHKVKNLLILICRILFISFLVIGFSQPFIPGSTAATTSDKEVTILVDNSYSMQNVHAEKDVSLLTFAVDKAKSILDFFPPSSVFSILQNNNLSSTKFPNAADARSALDKVNLSSIPGSSLKPPVTGHTFIFSDFQKNSFRLSSFNNINPNSQFHLVPVEAGNMANVYIDTVYLEDAFFSSEWGKHFAC